MEKLRKEALLDLKHMLSDPDIRAQFVFPDEREIAKYAQVKDDGSVILGKTSFPWWNRICNGELKIDVVNVCIRLNDILTGSSGVKNKQAFYEIFKDIASSVEMKDYSYAISRIFIGYRLGFCKDAETITSPSKKDGKRQEEKVIGTLEHIALIDGTGKPVLLGADGIFRNFIINKRQL